MHACAQTYLCKLGHCLSISASVSLPPSFSVSVFLYSTILASSHIIWLSLKSDSCVSCLPHTDGRYPRPVSRLSFRSKMRGLLFSTRRVDTQGLMEDLDDNGKGLTASLKLTSLNCFAWGRGRNVHWPISAGYASLIYATFCVMENCFLESELGLCYCYCRGEREKREVKRKGHPSFKTTFFPLNLSVIYPHKWTTC